MKNLKSETGRSMVEMLGVLAVIGVLSVGGIAGYNAAMDRMTLNKVLSLIDTVSMAVAVESGSDNEESFYRKPGLTEMERSKLFCDSYGAEWCAQENESSHLSYYLANGESGNHVLNATRKAPAIYWKLFRNDSAPGSCYCESDITLVIYNIKSITCDQIIDNLADKYQDVLAGFSGSNHATLDSPIIHETICQASERVYDSSKNIEPYKDTAIQLNLVFKGPDSSNCGNCKAKNCPC